MTPPEAEPSALVRWAAQETAKHVLPDATREEMLDAAGMTTGHRWEERYVDEVTPDADEQQDEGFIRSRTS